MAQHSEFGTWDQYYRRLKQVEGLPFSDLLIPERVADAVSALGLEFRERVFMPVVTIWTFLSQVLSPDHSCRDAVGRLLAWRTSQGLPPCSTDTSSYCEARQRLPLQLVRQIMRDTGRELEQQTEESWRWKGRHVKIADGTTVTMPDTPANQAAYPRRRNQTHGVGFPIARVVAIFSLACGAVLDAAMAPMRGKKTGENTLLLGLLSALEEGDVLLADRLFGSYRQFAACQLKHIDVVARQHQSRRTDSRRGKWLGTLDHVVEWRRPRFDSDRFDRSTWEALPKRMLVRELRFSVTQPGFRPTEITLVTTLLDSVTYSAAEICALYRERWNCELDLRSLKASLQMAHLRCKSPDMMEKEVYTHLLAYNLIRRTMAEAARQATVLPRRLSFKGAVQMVNAFASYLPRHGHNRDRLWGELLAAIASERVGDRPNRVEPRKLKYRQGNYPYMTHPRTEERRRLCA